MHRKVVVIGAGIAGLSAAIDLRARGFAVTVCERSSVPGGKMREIFLGDQAVDSGPTVLTMPWVFEELFQNTPLRFRDAVETESQAMIARHAWTDGTRLDLFADVAASAIAIEKSFNTEAADGYRAFIAHAADIYALVRKPFLRSQRPTIWTMLREASRLGLSSVTSIDAHQTLARSLSKFFVDARLRQLFGRYATYTGSSPYECPATLALIAHVEQEGVHVVKGGMSRLARGLERAATRLGVTFRFDCAASGIATDGKSASGVSTAQGFLEADAIVYAGDAAALAAGKLGAPAQAALRYDFSQKKRSFSAITFSMLAKTEGFPLAHHNVFFSSDYEAEFTAIRKNLTVPRHPTVYVCAQDRTYETRAIIKEERLFAIINAPPLGDTLREWKPDESKDAMLQLFQKSGMKIDILKAVATTPSDFEQLFPATGGALYGQATHGMLATLERPCARTKIRGLYLASGSVHPGAGIPMAALSGRLAAAAIDEDCVSTPRSPTTGIVGSTSMR